MWAVWIERYGYWAVLLGGILEGETVFILAGYSLSQGYLSVVPTFALAALGAITGDSVYYWLGRVFGARLIRSRRSLRPYRARATLLLRRWGHPAAFLCRFAYGLRVALPLLMGATRMRPSVFHTYNALGGLCFAALYLTLGLLFGEALEQILGRIGAREGWIMAALLGLGALIWTVREWRLLHTRDPRDPPA